MLVMIFLCLSAAVGIWAGAAGRAVWQAVLYALGCLAALNLIYVIWWVLVASFVDDSKPIEKPSALCRFGCGSIADWLCSWARVRVRVQGAEQIPREGRFVYICNHRSSFDPIVAAARLRQYNIAFISKPSNLKIPYIGKLAYGAGFLPIDRENDRKALKTILLAADYLKRGLCSIGIYPEGTRSKDGELLPFHAGSFKIAQKAGVPLVIAAVRGTEEIRKNYPLRPTAVNLEILEILPAETVRSMTTQELAAYSRERMERALKPEMQEAAG